MFEAVQPIKSKTCNSFSRNVNLYKSLKMTSLELKNNFHILIDSIDNENLLKKFYELMLNQRSQKSGDLWSKLSENDIDEILTSLEESNHESNIITNEEIKKKYSQWL
jgi:hypothetical protein